MSSFSIKSPECTTKGVDRYCLYFLLHLLSEVNVYRGEDFTSMGEMLCLDVTDGFRTRKSISILSSALCDALE